ncbi:probable cytochrome P450 6a23 isoform X1 [Pieris napi]|uniref:probable cytochrome P450 6a23 isoform X1 n=2 Tax=Pieris napi TaxID=78633 RepID=UPI001FB9D79B|nr:probable cytochrome P450 6a23 isoform X1 [Pieris napi]
MVTILLIATTIFFAFYAWFKYKFSYWARRGVKGPRPTFPFGNMRDVIFRRKQLFQPYCDSYNTYKHLPYVGLYSFSIPVLCINDPDLAKHILIKDFDYFQSHGIFTSSVGDPFGGHIFNIHGDKWKTLRTKLSPAFTLGKLKSFFPLVDKISNEGLQYGDMMYEKGEVINFSDFYSTYAMENISSIGFGVNNNGFKSNTEFHKRGRQFFEYTSFYRTVTRAIAFFAPEAFKALRINRFDPGIYNFFYNLVRDAVDYRKKNSYRRNDFLQTLIEIKDRDTLPSLSGTEEYRFTFNDIIANTLLYMFAGYETSAGTGMFAAYELAKNPAVQAKAREEVIRVLAKHNNEWTYEAQNDMTYITMVLEETMRKYPPMRALFRRCNKDFKVPDSDFVIENGTLLFIPIHAIQMDPDIFENPERFDPERFTPEKKAKMHPCHWMPFGEGPKKCLGIRQGYIQSKMLLVKLLTKYELSLDEKTEDPIRIKATSFSCAPESGIWIKLKKKDYFS